MHELFILLLRFYHDYVYLLEYLFTNSSYFFAKLSIDIHSFNDAYFLTHEDIYTYSYELQLLGTCLFVYSTDKNILFMHLSIKMTITCMIIDLFRYF